MIRQAGFVALAVLAIAVSGVVVLIVVVVFVAVVVSFCCFFPGLAEKLYHGGDMGGYSIYPFQYFSCSELVLNYFKVK